MQIKSALAALAAIAGISQACYLAVHSSTVRDFDVQHSEPSDHGGAPQFITSSHGACSFAGQLHDGCTVTVTSNNGCGSLSFTRNGNGKRQEGFIA